jgi:hypothetical protein
VPRTMLRKWRLAPNSNNVIILIIAINDYNVFFSFFFWPLYCLSFFNLRRLITSMVSSDFSSRVKL